MFPFRVLPQCVYLLNLFATKNLSVTKGHNQGTQVPSLMSYVIPLCGMFALL